MVGGTPLVGPWTKKILRAVIYLIILLGLIWVAPRIQDAITNAGPGTNVDDVAAMFPETAQGDGSTLSLIEQLVLSTALLIGALLLVAPIAWIYMVTKRQEGYQKTFVQVLFLLPVVVAAVVRVVRGDLALAFALAGIVAAVRFRTTLRDLKNAVFAFAVIGVGLAAGTGAFVLAAVLSIVFSAIALGLWKNRTGELDLTFAEPAGGMRLAEALVPGESHQSVAVGSEKLVGPLTRREIVQMSSHLKRLAHFVRADAIKKSNKYDTLFITWASDVDLGRNVTEGLLERYASRWHLVDSFPGLEATTVLVYLLRLSKEAEVGNLLEQLNCGHDCPLRAAEMKPIKGLRQMLTG